MLLENIAESVQQPVPKVNRCRGKISRCSECAIRKFSLSAYLSPDVHETVRSLRLGFRSLPPKARVCHEGDSTYEIFALCAGWAFRYTNLYDGGRQILDFILPGDFIGFPFTGLADHMTYSVETVTDVALCVFPTEAMLEQVQTNPAVASWIISTRAREEARAFERIIDLGRRTARERVAHLLLELFTRLRLRNAVSGTTADFPLSQNLLADALGLSTAHINRVLRQLREERIVTAINHKLTIHDLEGLEEICDYNETYLTARVSFDRSFGPKTDAGKSACIDGKSGLNGDIAMFDRVAPV